MSVSSNTPRLKPWKILQCGEVIFEYATQAERQNRLNTLLRNKEKNLATAYRLKPGTRPISNGA